MIRLTALALATTVGFLFALPVKAQDTAPPPFLGPPPKYDHPYRGGGGTVVKFFPKSEMSERCSKLAGRKMPGIPAECGKWRWVRDGKFLPVGTRDTRGAVKRCFVYITARFQGTPTADLLFRHGRAHCNGWSHPRRRTGQTSFLSEDSHNHEEYGK